MNNTIEIYHHLQRKGWTHSLHDFSNYYLGMNQNYACLRGDRMPSERALAHLFLRLWEERRYFMAARVARTILFGGPTQ